MGNQQSKSFQTNQSNRKKLQKKQSINPNQQDQDIIQFQNEQFKEQVKMQKIKQTNTSRLNIQKLLKPNGLQTKDNTIDNLDNRLNISVGNNKKFQIVKIGQYQIEGQFGNQPKQQLILNGFGSVKINGQLIFQGQFLNNLRNGYGIQYNTRNNKIIYEGYYVNDMRDGWGKTPQYEGQFCRNHKQGYGRGQCPEDSASYYQGYWKDGLQDGFGIKKFNHQYSNNDNFLPSLRKLMSSNSNLENGQNLNEIEGQQVYLGEWKQGKAFGLGKHRKGKLQSYQGEFVDGLYHGQGTLFGKQTKKGMFNKGIFLK